MTAAASAIAFGPAKIGGDAVLRRHGHESQSLSHGHTMTEGISEMLEESSAWPESYAERMREYLIDAGGDQRHGETRERWLERAARACRLSYRRAKGIYYRETKRVEIGEYEHAKQAAHVAKLRQIAELRARLDLLEKDIAKTDALAAGSASDPSALAHEGR